MNELPLSIADFVLLGIIFLSGSLAYFRGAVREFFFLATWGGAVAATFYLYRFTLPMVSGWVGEDPLIAALANTAGLFVISLTVLTLISMVSVKRAEDSKLSIHDRSLGFVFGLVRGVLVVCLIYLLYTSMVPTYEEQPEWLREARLTPVVAKGAEIMLALAPAEWGMQGERVAEQLKDTSSAIEPLVDYNDLVNPQPDVPETGNSTEDGYNDDYRSALDDMIGAEE